MTARSGAGAHVFPHLGVTMVESDRRRLITSTPHLTPEEVVQHAFATSFRGYAEAEVRAFLKRISEELVLGREREAELLGAVDSLEEQLRTPRPLDEAQLLDALGAETSRLLRSAREAADEIRTRAAQDAAAVAEAATAEAERTRTEADEHLAARLEEAETRAAALVSEAEARSVAIRAETDAEAAREQERAAREVEELIEAARHQGREMLDEAKATRERVLADLFRRRALLQAQIDELRGGRDNLLDAYRVVKRTFLEATEALAQVEARAAERPAHAVDADDAIEVADELAADTDSASDVGTGAETDSHAADAGVMVVEAPAANGAEAASEGPERERPGTEMPAGDHHEHEAEAGLADVDSLFARIRAGQAEVTIETTTVEVIAVEAAAVGSVEGGDEAGDSAETVDLTDDGAGPGASGQPEEAEEAETLSPVESWRARRAEALDPLLLAVAKRAKRTAQDDQNALLDGVRRHKGRPTSAQVLTPQADLIASWVAVVRESFDDAYAAGRVAVGGDAGAAGDELVTEAVTAIVAPLRERIGAAIDAGEDGDTGGLVERIGARFREWKNQSLENALADALAMAWTRGVYDASPDGTVLQWIPLVEGRCADCDDNGLEPTVKGSSFPTGQVHPPAHPGCRCLLAPSDVLSGLAASA